MKSRRALTWIAWMTAAFLMVVGCNRTTTTAPSPSPTTAAPAPVTLTISAAASLQEAMQEIQSTYRQEQPNATLTYNFGSSGSLQQQIEQGAPVDVFMSAAEKQMDALEQKQLLLGDTRQDLLRNEVVLITSKTGADISDFKDLISGEVDKVSIGDPGSVPAGEYGQEVLTTLKLFDPLKPKLVFAKDVRQVLSYVETGNVDAGIVYASDTKTSDQIRVVATAPANSYSPIVYPVAVLQGSKNTDAAREFVQFLSSAQAKKTFEEFGFIPVN